jgi:hypothetical protein
LKNLLEIGQSISHPKPLSRRTFSKGVLTTAQIAGPAPLP